MSQLSLILKLIKIKTILRIWSYRVSKKEIIEDVLIEDYDIHVPENDEINILDMSYNVDLLPNYHNMVDNIELLQDQDFVTFAVTTYVKEEIT